MKVIYFIRNYEIFLANMIISLINNFLRLKREFKPKNHRAVNFVAATSHAFIKDSISLEKCITELWIS